MPRHPSRVREENVEPQLRFLLLVGLAVGALISLSIPPPQPLSKTPSRASRHCCATNIFPTWAVRQPTKPDDVAPPTPNRTRAGIASGSHVNCVAPESSLERAVDVLLQPVHNASEPRQTRRLYVSGPSGSGKSRLGWEAYLEIKRQLSDFAVFYATCNLAEETLTSTAQVARHLVSSCAKRKATSPEDSTSVQLHPNSNFTLDGVFRGWLAAQSPAVLVLHLDEFQQNPELTLAIQKEAEDFNKRQRGGCFVLPICTGLLAKGASALKDIDASDRSTLIEMGFFSKGENSSPDHAKTWTVVRSAVRAVLGKDVLPKSLDAVPFLLRYLVEVLAGWPLGAVQLGGQLALSPVLRNAAKADTLAALSDVDFAACERGLDDVLRHLYGSTREKRVAPVTALADKLGPEGMFKLMLLALSPFQVRRVDMTLALPSHPSLQFPPTRC